MDGNVFYTTPAPTLLVTTAALKAFTDALSVAGGGGTTLTAIKNDRRVDLVSLLRSLAGYVQLNCQGSLSILLSSGFPIQKPQRQPVGPLPAPSNLALSLGTNSGELDASVTPVPGAATYNWRVMLASAPTVVVQTTKSTAASTTFTGLTPGLSICEANAVGTAGTGG
jgi:hypothetical protein